MLRKFPTGITRLRRSGAVFCFGAYFSRPREFSPEEKTMDIFEAMFTRRSIRKYTQDPVDDEDLKLLLKAAMLAPSASNRQPWHFVVVRDANVRAAIAERHPYAKMAADAPLLIVVCADLNEEKTPGFWVQDCSAATQNILLAARGQESGQCLVRPASGGGAHARCARDPESAGSCHASGPHLHRPSGPAL